MYTAALIFFGSCVGFLAARYTVMPLPYMMAPLLCTAALTLKFPALLPTSYKFPMRFRILFIAIIGVMIGARVTPDLVRSLPHYTPSVIAIILFVLSAQFGNQYIFRRFGNYDRTTAFYAGAPGGLMEAIALGEAAGCDVQKLMLQQFLRIILTITLVPIAISLWLGTPVGSASGVGLSMQDHLPTVTDGVSAAAIAAIGLALGLGLKIPAGQLMGPMLFAATVTVAGWAVIDLPNSVINFAQVVIGTSLGVRFKGMSKSAIARGIWLSLMSVTFMLALGACATVILGQVTDMQTLVLLISFAPGGVTEMSLIALSLAANPALVTLHHLVRILLTVVTMGFLGPKVDTAA